MYLLAAGLSWLVYWLLAHVFKVEHFNAVLGTAIIFILLGVLLQGYPRLARRQ